MIISQHHRALIFSLQVLRCDADLIVAAKKATAIGGDHEDHHDHHVDDDDDEDNIERTLQGQH